MRRAVITGIGAVSPNGIGRERFWEATRNGVSGVRRINIVYPGNKKPVITKISVNNPPPVIIERDFEIPVTYPYLNDSSVPPPINPIDKNVSTQSTIPSSE